MTTRSEKVKIFTEESLNKKLPDKPRLLTKEEIFFVIKMNCEELQELLMTVVPSTEDVKEVLLDIVSKSNSPQNYNYDKTEIELITEQVDAFVDIDYYNCNAAAKAGMNVDDVFDVVHQANMNKKFNDGTFHRNELGKVIKPPDWQEGDLITIINKWNSYGTWN
jgi:predicted HAD superfamily Cof-like phosphohydrolase